MKALEKEILETIFKNKEDIVKQNIGLITEERLIYLSKTPIEKVDINFVQNNMEVFDDMGTYQNKVLFYKVAGVDFEFAIIPQFGNEFIRSDEATLYYELKKEHLLSETFLKILEIELVNLKSYTGYSGLDSIENIQELKKQLEICFDLWGIEGLNFLKSMPQEGYTLRLLDEAISYDIKYSIEEFKLICDICPTPSEFDNITQYKNKMEVIDQFIHFIGIKELTQIHDKIEFEIWNEKKEKVFSKFKELYPDQQ